MRLGAAAYEVLRRVRKFYFECHVGSTVPFKFQKVSSERTCFLCASAPSPPSSQEKGCHKPIDLGVSLRRLPLAPAAAWLLSLFPIAFLFPSQFP